MVGETRPWEVKELLSHRLCLRDRLCALSCALDFSLSERFLVLFVPGVMVKERGRRATRLSPDLWERPQIRHSLMRLCKLWQRQPVRLQSQNVTTLISFLLFKCTREREGDYLTVLVVETMIALG